MLIGQSITLFGVKEPGLVVEQDRTTLREVASVVTRNDQLLWTAIAMVLFMTSFVTTTSFGVYFFKYAYGDENMYPPSQPSWAWGNSWALRCSPSCVAISADAPCSRSPSP